MAPIFAPDPSMHTIYIVDPREMFTRYAATFASTARLRESGSAGFLVLARLVYLAFGAVPGFFVTRYLLALVAVVPAYLLLRRLYGIPAGALAVIVLLSSPVIITAWGTDYPDSAVVSYVVGAVACLAMPCRDRWRPAWLALAGLLLTLAAWSHGMGIVLGVATIAAYGAVRLGRAREHLVRNGALLLGVAVSSTFLLMVASALVLGQFDFIRPTLAGAAYLNQPSQIVLNHSSNWRWVLYLSYLWVPPSVIAAFGVTFARKLRSIPTPQLFVGLACSAQLVLCTYLQFFNHVQTLEIHYFSSTLWGVIYLTLAVTLAELSRPLLVRPRARWLPGAVLFTVPLAYETYPHVPAFGWLPAGVALAAIPVVMTGMMRLDSRGRPAPWAPRAWLGFAVATTVVAMAGSLLVLTVAPSPPVPPLPGLTNENPPPEYASALGGDASLLIDWYQITADVPSFVGNATYRGEQLLMWFPWDQLGSLVEPYGMYHAAFDSLSTGFPVLTGADATILANRRPAELLLLSTTGDQFGTAFAALAPYRPVLVRTTVMRQGPAVLHAWLILLFVFLAK